MVQLSKTQIKQLQKNHNVNTTEPIIIPVPEPIIDIKPKIYLPSDTVITINTNEIKPVVSPIVYPTNIPIVKPVITSVVSSINKPFIAPVSVPFIKK